MAQARCSERRPRLSPGTPSDFQVDPSTDSPFRGIRDCGLHFSVHGIVGSHVLALAAVCSPMTERRVRLYDYPPSCNCYKVRLLLAQLRIAYERVPIDIFAGETLTDEYARVNPTRTTPVLETGDDRHLPESNAILVYLAEAPPTYPRTRWSSRRSCGGSSTSRPTSSR